MCFAEMFLLLFTKPRYYAEFFICMLSQAISVCQWVYAAEQLPILCIDYRCMVFMTIHVKIKDKFEKALEDLISLYSSD